MSGHTRASLYILEGHTPVPVARQDPAAVEQWGHWFMTADRQVARTTCANGTMIVSTVFLGMDHEWRPGAPPLLFETMVFRGENSGAQWRGATWDEAAAHHAWIVEQIAQQWSPVTGMDVTCLEELPEESLEDWNKKVDALIAEWLAREG